MCSRAVSGSCCGRSRECGKAPGTNWTRKSSPCHRTHGCSWRKFADAVEAELPEGREFETIRPFAAKAAEHACRIAGVIAAYTGKMEVSDGVMRCARELAKHYAAEAVRLTNAAAISAEAEKLERMRKWLTGKWSEEFVSPPDAARLGPFRETKVVKKMFSELADLGWLVTVDEGAVVLGRKRREAFRVVGAKS